MKKVLTCGLLIICTLLFGCAEYISAEEKLLGAVERFSLSDMGTVYSGNPDSEHYLSDEMLSSMFALGGNVTAFSHVTGRCAFFFRDFSGGEIVTLELSDISHREEIESMMKRRAKKKNGAEVFSRGNLVYLVCAPDEIAEYLRKN